MENVFFPSTNLPVIGKDAFKNSKDGMNIVLPEGADLTEWTNALINAGATNPNFNIGSRYGLYKADGKVYNCDSTGTPTSGEIDKFDVSYLFIADDVTQVINTMGFYKYGVLRTIDMTHATQLTAIGNEAFANCSTLNTVIVGKGITSIGSRAFFECENLQYVDLSQAGSLTKIDFQAFYTCSRLVDISFNLVNPPVIEMGAFDGTKEFLRIHLPDNTKKSDWEGKLNGARNPVLCVGSLNSLYKSDGNIYFSDSNGKDEGAKIDSAGQKNITYMSIASDVKKIADSAFAKCGAIENVDLSQLTALKKISKLTFADCVNLRNIKFPDNITVIGEQAFYGCKKLETLQLPSSLNTIEPAAFNNCNALKAVDFSKATQLKTIGDYAFQRCLNLKNLIISPSVTDMGYGVFWECGELESIVLPPNITEIKDRTFELCVKLVEISVPEKVTKIGELAFEGCSSLVNVRLPKSLESIGFGTFFGCTGLTSIYIPGNTKNIGDMAFWQCSNLANVSSYATAPPTMNADTFSGTTDGIKIYLLANADENSWRSALINSGAKNPTFDKIVLPTGEIKIKENSFKTTISNITFDLFYKDSVDVELIINGTQSMNQSVEYQKVSKPEDYKEDGIWTAYTGIININKAEKCIIYARNIDKFGNKTIINSNGFAVYQDSTIQPSTLEFDKESTKQADIDLAMTLNGNVLKKIKDGTEILVKDTDYFIKGSTVTLKKKYLAKLANGSKTLDFNFAAMGVPNGPIMTIPFHFTVKDTTHVHVWDDGIITVPANTEKEGVKTFTCTICKKTKTEPIMKIPAIIKGANETSTHGSDIVETGSADISHYIVLLLISGSTLIVLAIRKKRTN